LCLRRQIPRDVHTHTCQRATLDDTDCSSTLAEGNISHGCHKGSEKLHRRILNPTKCGTAMQPQSSCHEDRGPIHMQCSELPTIWHTRYSYYTLSYKVAVHHTNSNLMTCMQRGHFEEVIESDQDTLPHFLWASFPRIAIMLSQ
jgi:hypothetical protein